ncbi:MAG TPA: hypothetical protein VNR70_08040 [Steroidobacteraceae bacterium]|nr:hypothetical protein [Steroidobacteraceae bacterium]
MSPLWRDEVGIYLAQRRVCLVRIRRGIRPSLAAELDHADPLAAAGWDGALALLERQFAESTWSDARVRVVIADHWVRYSVVPWSDALSSATERLAHARELMTGVFGAEMSDWTVSLSDAPPGSSRLASAMPTALLQALRDSAARHGHRLASVQPQLIAAYNTWRHVLPAGEAAWFVTVEEGSLAALRMCGDGIDRVHAVRIGLDWARELKRLQTFGRLASASPNDGRVYVDLPEALRTLRPDASADLEWLHEPNPPLTTLHRLEHLRRRAA